MPTKKLVVSTYGQYILIAPGVLVWTIALCTERFFEGPDLAIPVGSWVVLTEIVPVLGASLEAIPPVAHDSTRASSVAALLLFAKQLEGNVLVPRIVGGIMGIHRALRDPRGPALYGMMGAVFTASRHLGETLVSAGGPVLEEACAAVPAGKVRDDRSEAGDGR